MMRSPVSILQWAAATATAPDNVPLPFALTSLVKLNVPPIAPPFEQLALMFAVTVGPAAATDCTATLFDVGVGDPTARARLAKTADAIARASARDTVACCGLVESPQPAAVTSARPASMCTTFLERRI